MINGRGQENADGFPNFDQKRRKYSADINIEKKESENHSNNVSRDRSLPKVQMPSFNSFTKDQLK